MTTRRETIVRVDGQSVDDGAASLLVYKLDDRIEIVATEEANGDASVMLTLDEARHLSEALRKAAT